MTSDREAFFVLLMGFIAGVLASVVVGAFVLDNSRHEATQLALEFAYPCASHAGKEVEIKSLGNFACVFGKWSNQ